MKQERATNAVRIGVFYDGNYFLHVSNFYNYIHPRRNRISISGLHKFIRNQIAYEENADVRLCQIVDAHYFRTRLSAQEASLKGNLLYYDRVFDDILMSEGVITHYFPTRKSFPYKQEKDLDIWLALEAYELAFYKNFTHIVLIACDGDFAPLVRKLNTLGTRVMILGWDFEYVDDEGQRIITKTSQEIMKESAYPLNMYEIIEAGIKRNDPMINALFVPASPAKPAPTRIDANMGTTDFHPSFHNQVHPPFTPKPNTEEDGEEDFHNGIILSLKNGYGFIKYPPNNIFFHFSNLVDTDPNELQEGDTVMFVMDYNDANEPVAKNVRLILSERDNQNF